MIPSYNVQVEETARCAPHIEHLAAPFHDRAAWEGFSSPLQMFTVLEDSSAAKLAVPIDATEWTKAMERNFVLLAEKEALGIITPQEKGQLLASQERRRALRNPRSGHEIIWEYQQRKLTRSLVSALEVYVKFHSSTSNPWADAQENVYEHDIP